LADPAVRKEAAEARLKEIEVLKAELAFFEDLKKAGAVIRVDADGAWTVLPAPPDLNLLDVVEPLPDLSPRLPGPGQILSGPRQPLPPGLDKLPKRNPVCRLKDFRLNLGLTKTELAKRAGVRTATITRAEDDPGSVSLETKRRIVEGLNKKAIRGAAAVTLSQVFPK
jgi:DNA-binding XRE family transcriptional regulator